MGLEALLARTRSHGKSGIEKTGTIRSKALGLEKIIDRIIRRVNKKFIFGETLSKQA